MRGFGGRGCRAACERPGGGVGREGRRYGEPEYHDRGRYAPADHKRNARGVTSLMPCYPHPDGVLSRTPDADTGHFGSRMVAALIGYRRYRRAGGEARR
ncbi:hypothetical protein TPA0910_33090 [Streptomyces hygroscopicus subsp. sporocinereus]|uniref:Uncharacterized protein n=1 Tax=Streptomyces hygroscopicus TaxID=1912 RepID=A0ABQ3U0H6_STRHY|nr:hypothetical protein TPA0910_33090 [Streptomyces hygroscopicus]